MSSPNLAIPHLAASQSQKTVTVNAAIDDLDNALNALTSIAISDANQTFTQAQMASGCVFVITGTLTADRTIVVPSIPRLFAMKNSTSGGHNLVVKTSAGTGITFLSTAGYVILYCDGTNVQELSAASTGGTVDIGGDIGGTSSSPEVIGIEAVPISAAPTVVGEALVYNGTDWVPSLVATIVQSVDSTGHTATYNSAPGYTIPTGGAYVSANISVNFSSGSGTVTLTLTLSSGGTVTMAIAGSAGLGTLTFVGFLPATVTLTPSWVLSGTANFDAHYRLLNVPAV